MNGRLLRPGFAVTLMKEDAPQRDHPLHEVFNGLRYIVRTGMQWRMMPNDLPPWYTVYQESQGRHRRIGRSRLRRSGLHR